MPKLVDPQNAADACRWRRLADYRHSAFDASLAPATSASSLAQAISA